MKQARTASAEHYEVELRELAYEDGDEDSRAVGFAWKAILASRADAIPTPLTFGTLAEARAYAVRAGRGSVRIVRVAGDGGREVIE
jgi:hypothetical protein